MPVYRFEEQLNDLMDYFLVGDVDLLYQFKEKEKLPDDLITEFTTQNSGDRVVEEGIMIPIAGIDNHPYTVFFNISEDQIELSKNHNRIVHKQHGYILYVSTKRIYLYTMPYLRNFKKNTVSSLKSQKKAYVDLPNGWYSVNIFVGYICEKFKTSQQKSQIIWEPAIEFSIHPKKNKPEYKGDVDYLFSLEN